MQVKILSDQEFEALPYPEMSTSVGVADPQTRTAYVRKTHIPIIDAFTIAHELEHLQDGGHGVHADHYRNGVYYKGFGDVMRVVAPIAGMLIGGPVLGPMFASGFGIPALGMGAAGTAAGAAAGSGIAGGIAESSHNKHVQKQAMSQQSQQQPMMGGGNPMESFQPQAQPSHPNVVQVGGQISESGGFGGGINESTIQKIRGHFSGRNPQERF